jgi:hypothetical protein
MYNASMIEQRLYKVNNDTVLEITETVQQKTQHSEVALLRDRAHHATTIERSQAKLGEIDALLTIIHNEKIKKG